MVAAAGPRWVPGAGLPALTGLPLSEGVRKVMLVPSGDRLGQQCGG